MNKNKNNISDNEEIFDCLDDLNLEETEILLSGIDKVTLSPDEGISLRTKVLKRAGAEGMGTTQEANTKTENGKRDRRMRNRIFMGRTAACIAAIMICSSIAIASVNMDALQRYWGNDAEIYRDRALETIQSVQNDNVKVNIEGIVSDHYQCVLVISVEALSEKGQEIIKKYNNKHMVLDLKIKPAMVEGAENQCQFGAFQYTDDNKNKNYKSYKCDFPLKNVDLTKPVTVEFAGLSMNFNIPEYMQVITLYPDSNEGVEKVELSPIGYYYENADAEYADQIRLIHKDGTIDEELGYFGSMVKDDNGKVTIIGSFTRLVDLNDYAGIQIDGVNYIAE